MCCYYLSIAILFHTSEENQSELIAMHVCLSSQSEVAKPLEGWHAKSLTNIRSAFTSEPKTLDYELKLRNI